MDGEDILPLAFSGISAVMALIATAISLFSLWLQIDRRRVRLVVRPTWLYQVYDGGEIDREGWLSVEVINLSEFAVTVVDAGFTLPRGRKATIVRAATVFDGRGFPRRLEPHDSVTLSIRPEGLPTEIQKAYARTTSDEIRTGGGPAIKTFRQRTRAR